MKRFEAKYLFYTYNRNLELVNTESVKESDAKFSMEKIKSEAEKVPMYTVTLSFKAADNIEALRMAAINTDQSLLVFKELEPVSYHIELVEKRWLGNKVIEDQFFLYRSLSA